MGEEDHMLPHSSFSLSCATHSEIPGVLPDPDPYPDPDLVSALRWCIRTSAVSVGALAHARVVSVGAAVAAVPPLANLILQMYAACGRLPHARRVFDRMRVRSSFSADIMIGAYARADGLGKQALELFRHLLLVQTDRLNPTKFTFVSVLSACASTAAFNEARLIHLLVVAKGVESDVFVGTSLVNAYGKCGRLKEARAVFNYMPHRNIITWNSLISAYAQTGQSNDANATLVDANGECKVLKEAKAVYNSMPRWNAIIRNALISTDAQTGHINDANAMADDAHGKCRLSKEVKAVFNSMPHWNAITQNTLISADAQTGNDANATLVNVYGKCGLSKEAKAVYDSMPHWNTTTRNALISAEAQTGHSNDASTTFGYSSLVGAHAQERRSKDANIVPKNSLNAQIGDSKYGHIIPGSSQIAQIGLGKEACFISRSPLIARNEQSEDAHMIPNSLIPKKESSNDAHIIEGNSHIGAHAQIGHSKDALDLFQRMIIEGYKPNRITFLCILEACGNLGSPENGRAIHGLAVASGLDSEVSVGTALLNMYGKCGSLGDSRSVFEKMNRRDLVSWNAMLTAYARKGQGKEVLDLHVRMESESIKANKVTLLCVLEACTCVGSLVKGRSVHQCIVKSGLNSDLAVSNAIIHMYGKCNSPSEARAVFDQLCQRNVISWTSMISAYALNGYCEEALELFWQMDILPNKITFTTVLDACASLGSLEHGRAVHRCISSSEWGSDISVATSLVNMYGKCGSLDDARLVFDGIADCDLVLWNSMIGAYAHNGHGKEALEIFGHMLQKGVKPSSTTFIGVLSACSHAGLLQEGRHHFSTMIKKYGLRPSSDHYVCMIDLLGRAGYLDEAEEMVANLHAQPDAVAWLTLLGRKS